MTTEERIAQIAQGFGQGIQNFQSIQNAKKQESIQEEARKRKEALDAVAISEQLSNQSGKVVDPSAILPMYRAGDFSGLSDILSSSPISPKYQSELDRAAREQKKYELQMQKLQNDINRKSGGTNGVSYKEQLQIKKLEGDLQKKSDPLEKLGTEGKKMVGIANEGLNAVIGMEEALDKGISPSYVDSGTPLLGNFISDNEFTANQRAAAEQYGRLQSGGAINKDEEARFIAMGPRPGDSPEIQRSKLMSQKKALEDKMKILGINEEVLSKIGVQRRPSITNQGQKQQAPLSVPNIVSEAYASDPEYQEYLMLMKKAGQ